MKVKILTSFPKKTIHVDDVFFSSDLHLYHQAVIDFGREFKDIPNMNYEIVTEINRLVGKNCLLVLMGDTMMGEKDYGMLLDSLICENIIILYGNHCNMGKLLNTKSDKLLYVGHYLELVCQGQIFCCQHYPSFNWNYQDDGSIALHGHLHADENVVVKEMHKYKCMDVGIDNYHKMYGKYSVFSIEQVQELLKDKLVIGRHGE